MFIDQIDAVGSVVSRHTRIPKYIRVLVQHRAKPRVDGRLPILLIRRRPWDASLGVRHT